MLVNFVSSANADVSIGSGRYALVALLSDFSCWVALVSTGDRLCQWVSLLGSRDVYLKMPVCCAHFLAKEMFILVRWNCSSLDRLYFAAFLWFLLCDRQECGKTGKSSAPKMHRRGKKSKRFLQNFRKLIQVLKAARSRSGNIFQVAFQSQHRAPNPFLPFMGSCSNIFSLTWKTTVPSYISSTLRADGLKTAMSQTNLIHSLLSGKDQIPIYRGE